MSTAASKPQCDGEASLPLDARRTYSRAAQRLAIGTSITTFFLLLAGALVTSNDAGDSVPDWPLAFGTLLPIGNITGLVVFEYSHRVLAAIVAVLTASLCIALFRTEQRRRIRAAGLTAVALVLVQATLGGMRVILGHESGAVVAIIHATTAQLFLATTVALSVWTGKAWRSGAWQSELWSSIAEPASKRTFYIGLLALVSVFAQIVLGAAYRHHLLGISAHIAGSAVVMVTLTWLAVRTLRRSTGLRSPATLVPAAASQGIPADKHHFQAQPARLLVALLGAQVALGSTVQLFIRLLGEHAERVQAVTWIGVAHVGGAAGVTATLVVLIMRIYAGAGLQTRLNIRLDRLRHYLTLTKPRLSMLLVAVAAASFLLASDDNLNWAGLAFIVLGTELFAAGLFALNGYLERDADALMSRTARRPLPAGRVRPVEALSLGIALCTGSVVLLALTVNLLTAGLAVTTLLIYIGVYTPMKRVSPLHTAVGAVAGAIPPLSGWAAATGTLSAEAWVLFAIVFFWQFPHFLAIEIVYREDYLRSGMKVLPVVDREGRIVRLQLIAGLALLSVSSLVPVFLGLVHPAYTAAAIVLALYFGRAGLRTCVHYARPPARALLRASVIYLPLLFGVMVLVAV